jgi:hypothetical protein
MRGKGNGDFLTFEMATIETFELRGGNVDTDCLGELRGVDLINETANQVCLANSRFTQDDD